MSELRGAHDDFGRVASWDDEQAERWAAALDLRASADDQRRLREEIVAASGVRAGGTVVEIGCGTGHLLAAFAEVVGESGRVVGVEPQPVLAQAARERLAPLGERCEIRVERGFEVALAGGFADACVAQTVLCHVPSPEREATLERMIRLTRPGGRVVSSDQDAETWTVDHPDRELTRRIVAFYSEQRFADGWTGRRLRSLFLDAGLAEVETRVVVVVETDPDSYGFRVAVDRADTAAKGGHITETELSGWVRALDERAAAARFFTSLNYYVAVGTVPT